jgi:hypothetical protein
MLAMALSKQLSRDAMLMMVLLSHAGDGDVYTCWGWHY